MASIIILLWQLSPSHHTGAQHSVRTNDLQCGSLLGLLLGPVSPLLLRSCHGSCLAHPAGLRMDPASCSSLSSSWVKLESVACGGLAAA